MPPVRTKTIERRSPGAFETYKATAASTIEAGELVRVTGTSSGDAYYIVQKALGDGSQVGKLMVATIKSNGGYLLVSNSDTLTLDTSAATLGDPVYASASVAGAATLAATSEEIGWVTGIGTSGTVLIEPAGAGGGGGATTTIDTFANRPASGTSAGDTHKATDGVESVWDGSAWRKMWPGIGELKHNVDLTAGWTTESGAGTFTSRGGFIEFTGAGGRFSRSAQSSVALDLVIGLARAQNADGGTAPANFNIGLADSATDNGALLYSRSDTQSDRVIAWTNWVTDTGITIRFTGATNYSPASGLGGAEWFRIQNLGSTTKFSRGVSPNGPWSELTTVTNATDINSNPDTVVLTLGAPATIIYWNEV